MAMMMGQDTYKVFMRIVQAQEQHVSMSCFWSMSMVYRIHQEDPPTL